MIDSSTFWRTVISGIIATFAMMMIAFLQGGFSLPVIDVGLFLKEAFNMAHNGEPYDLLWGNVVYYMGGILLALLWVVFLQDRVPGNRLVQGLLYGLAISILAALVISPIVSMAAGEGFGVFYLNTWYPGLMLLSGLIMHLGYGLILMLCLKVAGVTEK